MLAQFFIDANTAVIDLKCKTLRICIKRKIAAHPYKP